jgi:hypothetical protein
MGMDGSNLFDVKIEDVDLDDLTMIGQVRVGDGWSISQVVPHRVASGRVKAMVVLVRQSVPAAPSLRLIPSDVEVVSGTL